MSKILLIEDKRYRQDKFVQESGFDFAHYESILINKLGEEAKEVARAFATTGEIEDAQAYSAILSHKSLFEEEIASKLEHYCRSTGKILVWFSGGIDANYYSKEEGYELLEINVTTLYSKNLELFLEDFKQGNNNPLILSYGKMWRVNIALNALEDLTYFMQEIEKEEVLTKKFYRENLYIEQLYKMHLLTQDTMPQEKRITKTEMLTIKKALKKFIGHELKQ